MKILIVLATLIASQNALASQIFTCYRENQSVATLIRLNSLTSLSYVTDWDFDGRYELNSNYKVQMWNSFVGTQSHNSFVELKVPGKMFHGKSGTVYEVTHSDSQTDPEVSVFKCIPGQHEYIGYQFDSDEE